MMTVTIIVHRRVLVPVHLCPVLVMAPVAFGDDARSAVGSVYMAIANKTTAETSIAKLDLQHKSDRAGERERDRDRAIEREREG